MIRAAVLGKPITHSLSPLVPGLIYEELGLEHEYTRFELDVTEAITFLRREISKGWSGFSLTMPLKEVGFALDLPVDELASRARSINTITPHGCFNTDISGLVRVLRHSTSDLSEVVIIGNGATARSSLIALERLGSVREVTIVRRDDRKDDLLPTVSNMSMRFIRFDDIFSEPFGDRTLLISTVPGNVQESFLDKFVDYRGTLVDFSYSPWPSALAKVCRGEVVSGLPILVSQAIDQARLFTGLTFDEEAMYEKILSSTVRELGMK